jgi:hypothetical protein
MNNLESYEPGDVLPNGDIVALWYGPEDDPALPPMSRRPLPRGEIWVTAEQAERAFVHGWQCSGREPQNSLVVIKKI